MAVYSIGVPIVGAQIKFKKNDTTTIVQVKKGDTLTDIVLDRYPAEVTIASADVVGFTLKSARMPRGASRVYDGIPTYLPDNRGDHHFGLVEEVSEIDKILLEIPGETEDDPSTKEMLSLSEIKSFTGGTAVTPGSDGDETGSKNPPDETVEGTEVGVNPGFEG